MKLHADRKLRRVFALAVAATSVNAACLLGTVAILGRWGDTGQVGEWTLALALTAPTYVFAYCRLRSVVATDVVGEYEWAQYLAHRIVGSILAAAVSVAVASLIYRGYTAAIVAVMALGRCGDAVSDLVYGLDFRRGTAGRAAKSSINRSVGGFVVFTAVFAFTGSVWTSVGTQALVFVVGAALDIYLGVARPGTEWRPNFRRHDLWRLTRQVLPLGVAGAIATLQITAPRYIIAAERSKSELGVFGLLSSGLTIGNLVIGAASQAAAPKLAELGVSRRWTDFRNLLGRLIALGAGLAVLSYSFCILAGRDVLSWFFGPVVASHSDALVWLSVAFGLLWTYVYLGTALEAVRSFAAQPWIQGASATVTVIASVVFIPGHGLVGAAWALLSGFIVECIGYLATLGSTIRQRMKVQA